MSEPRIHLRHLRALGYCAAGVRAWCAEHGIDYQSLIREGIPVEQCIGVGDALSDRAIALAIEEAKHAQTQDL